MFTGIIEETGTVASILKNEKSARLSIAGSVIFDLLRPGDSVAVNGVCLTAARITGNAFCADVMNETIRRSNLGELRPGAKVNLERAMRADGRFGGHLVYGHIDGTGRIASMERDDNATRIAVEAPEAILKYVVEKGSIAVDGISLTVAGVSKDSFWVSVIPHTGGNTTLLLKKAGDIVNLENDVVGKYIEKFANAKEQKQNKGISAEFLLNAGF